MSGLWLGLSLIIAAVTIWLPGGRWTIAAALALIAVGTVAVSRFRASATTIPDRWPRAALSFLALLAVAAFAVPTFGQWACAAAAVGLIVRVIAGRRRMGMAVAEAILAAGLVAVGSALLQPLYLSLWSRTQGWPLLATLMQGVATAAGWDARAWSATLTLRDGDTVYRHALTAEGVLPFPLFCLALWGAALSLIGRRRASNALRCAAVLGFYSLARYLLLVRLTVEGFSADLFWDPVVLSLSTVAAAPLMALTATSAGPARERFLPTAEDRPSKASDRINGSPLRRPHVAARAAVLALAVGAAVGLSAWTNAGVSKAGRVLIDESHSDWTSSLRPFATDWFGNEATYNYASFAEYLNHFFRVSLNDRAPLTTRLLAGYDVLLVKMPTRAYTPDEREAIDAFVRRGGGLWLIGDHTNVFGTSTHLNALSAPMGLRFREDATWELGNGGPALWTPASASATHPVLRRVARFEFQTGCSLQASLAANDLMIAPRTVSRAADYATPNFFPQARPNNFDGAFGPALLAASTRRGAGRVVAFTDSTSFSTFSMFATGRPEFAVNTVAWLNQRNRPAWPGWAGWLLALAAATWLVAGAARASGDRHRSGASLLPVSAIVLSLLLGGVIGSQALAVALSPARSVRPEAPLRRVYFLTEGSDALFENLDPLYWNVADDPARERRFTTFLIGTQRFGLVPTVVERVPDADRFGDLLVIARPHRPLPAAEQQRLEAFVRRGGRVLVLPDTGAGGTREATLDDLLRHFGLSCAGRAPGEARVHVPGAQMRPRFREPFQFDGGAAVARAYTGAHPDSGPDVLARADLGRGFLLVAGDGQLFANATLGNHFDVPSGAQWDATALQLWLFRQLLLADRAVTRAFPPRCGPTDWANDSPDRPAAPGAKRRI